MRPLALFFHSEHESHIICEVRNRGYPILTYFVSKLGIVIRYILQIELIVGSN